MSVNKSRLAVKTMPFCVASVIRVSAAGAQNQTGRHWAGKEVLWVVWENGKKLVVKTTRRSHWLRLVDRKGSGSPFDQLQVLSRI